MCSGLRGRLPRGPALEKEPGRPSVDKLVGVSTAARPVKDLVLLQLQFYPSLVTSICYGFGLKNKTKQNKKPTNKQTKTKKEDTRG